MSQNPPNPAEPSLTMFDVLRFLVRRVGGHDDGQTYDLLSVIDGTEQGHPDLASYRAAQDAERKQQLSDAQTPEQRATAATAQASQLSDADLEAETVRRAAVKAAQQQARPAQVSADNAPAFVPPAAPAAPTAAPWTPPGS